MYCFTILFVVVSFSFHLSPRGANRRLSDLVGLRFHSDRFKCSVGGNIYQRFVTCFQGHIDMVALPMFSECSSANHP